MYVFVMCACVCVCVCVCVIVVVVIVVDVVCVFLSHCFTGLILAHILYICRPFHFETQFLIV